MQTDGWPETDEDKQPDLMTLHDLQLAKTAILNWVQDLRAQPEVDLLMHSLSSFTPCDPNANLLYKLT